MRACTQQARLVPSWPESIPPPPPLGCVNPLHFLFRPDYCDPSAPLSSLHPSLVPDSCQQKRCGPWPWAPPHHHYPRAPALATPQQRLTVWHCALSKNISPSHTGPSWPFRSSLSYCPVHFYPACVLPNSSLSSGFYIPAVWNQHPGDSVWRPDPTSEPEPQRWGKTARPGLFGS